MKMMIINYNVNDNYYWRTKKISDRVYNNIIVLKNEDDNNNYKTIVCYFIIV